LKSGAYSGAESLPLERNNLSPSPGPIPEYAPG